MDEEKKLEVMEGESEGEARLVSLKEGEQINDESNSLSPQVLEEIREEVSRRFQSAKDKRWAQLEKQYGMLSENQVKIETEETILSKPGKAEKIIDAVTQLIADLGLEGEPEVIDMLQENGRTEDLAVFLGMVNQIVKVGMRKEMTEKARAGSVIQPGGGIVPMENLQQVYDRKKKKLRPGDVNGLLTLKREFRNKGLKVY